MAATGLLFLAAACAESPAITSFTADKPTVPYGDFVTLRWTVRDATTVSLAGVGAVPGTSRTVSPPPGDVTYTLTASGSHGAPVSKSLTVRGTGGVKVVPGIFRGPFLNGTTFLLKPLSNSGGLPVTDTRVTVRTGGVTQAAHTVTLVCPAAQALCAAAFPDLPPDSGPFSVSAQVDGSTVEFQVAPPTGMLEALRVTPSVSSSGSVHLEWSAVPGALSYEAHLWDLDTGAEAVPSVAVSGTSAELTPPTPLANHAYSVFVDAFTFAPGSLPSRDPLQPQNISRGVAFLNQLPQSAFQAYAESDYQGDSLTLTFPGLLSTEHVALIPINGTETDNVTASLSVTGTSDLVPLSVASKTALNFPSLSPGPVARATELIRAGHDAIHAQRAQALRNLFAAHPSPALISGTPRPLAVAEPPATTAFCVTQGLTGGFVRKSAMLVSSTAHAAFYVDQDDVGDYAAYAPSLFSELASRWEQGIYPTDTAIFGAESDVDRNGRLLVFFSHELGAPMKHGLVLGYYDSLDVSVPRDTSADCSSSASRGSNGADMFYMNDIKNVVAIKPASEDAVTFAQTLYSDTLAHEFQHLINYNQHHLVAQLRAEEDTWINEGLSVIAEDVCGYEWHTPDGRRAGSRYLDFYPDEPNANAPLRYTTASLTHWQGDPIGNYEGAHSFFRYWADRRGNGYLGRLVQSSSVGVGNLSQTLGVSLPQAMVEWTTTLMFSNESFAPAPRFNFLGPDWTPFHSALFNPRNCTATPPFQGRYGYVHYQPLTVASGATAHLRATGWNAFVTGPGKGQDVKVTLNSPTHVSLVAVRFLGELPVGYFPTCP